MVETREHPDVSGDEPNWDAMVEEQPDSPAPNLTRRPRKPQKSQKPRKTTTAAIGAAAAVEAAVAATPAAPLDGPLPPVALREIEDADIDRLWDWLREDEDRGATFFGRTIATARELYQWSAAVQQVVATGHGLAFALDADGEPHGLVLLLPLEGDTGTVHLYLRPDRRGAISAILKALLQLCDTQMPMLSLRVATSDPRLMRLYRPLGFDVQYTLTRPAATPRETLAAQDAADEDEENDGS